MTGRQGSLPGQTLVARSLAALLRAYQLGVSPVLAPHCRYWPSCSDYALEALHLHGAGRGSWLAARRLCRCHPWSEGGVDPVPPAPSDVGGRPPLLVSRERAHGSDR